MAQDVSMRAPARQLTDEDQARLTALLGKGSLQPVERGELAALSRRGSQGDRDAAYDKLRTPTGKRRQQGVNPQRVAQVMGEAVATAVDKALDRRGL